MVFVNISWKCIKYMKYYFYQLFLNSQNFKSYSTKIFMSILQQLLYSINKTRKQNYVQDQKLVPQSHLNNSVLFIFECEAIFFSTVHIKLQRQQTANCDPECCCNDCISFHSCLGQNLAVLNLKPTFIMTLPFSLTSASYSQML